MSTETLAKRVGTSAAESPLFWKLQRLFRQLPSAGAETLEAWLVDVANSRGALVVRRQKLPPGFAVPQSSLSDEELVIGLVLPRLADEPQILRLAAQLVSRGALDTRRLLTSARREGAVRILRDLAKQALRIAPDHSAWQGIAEATSDVPVLQEHVIHWTRLAEPVMPKAGVHRGEWRLVA